MRPATRLPSPEPVTPERIEQALVRLASIVVQDGTEVYLPILERLEAELIEARRIGTPRQRAERVLKDYGTGWIRA
ncbi:MULTISPECIES: hypothetical protein [Methylobacterium]|uniref:Uncharacterized protein n=2 Tax=Methylobacterium TaxID=407 RepID=A0A8H8WYQ9_9HYPH|nr:MULTISPECIES: hypothetical protein [Methylobacterium]TNC08428.1 hypothetical protein FF100_29240 [Methylobacterium terricola]BCM86854.1 hypothetical protein mvi_53150 [Methylobacterium indicum]